MSAPEVASTAPVPARGSNKEGGKESALMITLRTIRPVLPAVAVALVLQIVGSILAGIQFLALAELAHRLLTRGGDADALRDPTLLFLTALGFSVLGGALALLVTHIADVELQARLRLKLARKLSRLPLGWFDARSSGRVRQLAQNDVDSLHQLVAHTIVEFTAGVLTPLVSMIVCCVLDWRLGLVALIPAVLYVLTYSLLAPRSNAEVMDRIHEGLAGVSEAIVEYVNGIAVLKIFGRAGQGSRRFAERSTRFLTEFAEMVRPQMRAHAGAVIFLSAATAGAVEVAFGLWFVRAGWSRPADLVVVTVIAMLLPAAVQTVAVSQRSLTQAVDAARRISEVLHEPELPRPEQPIRPSGTAVSLRDLTFGYDPDHPVVRNVTADLPAGGVTALVGPSGSGKSTLASLIARHRDPHGGSVAIGGVDVRDIDPEVLRGLVGTVFQDPQLMALSVAENIRLGSPGASDAEVEAAARAANIHHRIACLPRGYDSVIGEDARLSGGEAQRVGIARTLLADAPILLLDEATSATDPEAEAAVQEGLNRLTAGRTVVVIAHRLTTVVDADAILVMDGGRVVERGTHRELLAAGGRYARLWEDMEQNEEEVTK
ncbi:ABC transporter ATP-binding protein [Corynebacterium mastitidis]|uniref:ABC transporter ATP-binding protein n=1 Tax=Corynebacterium mastitidis TaxID=161890 RepID=UPI00254C3002|nr:ABC transporter ATP-binding protein [Corynebacterium mastitidis]MDK8451329.1 ABC transporter ATP-binding protein [Corynebacterium mastitidis]